MMAVKYHLIIQSYTCDGNMETEIRKNIGRHVIICVVERENVERAVSLKKKQDNLFLFLYNRKGSQEVEEKDKSYLAGEICKSTELEQLLI